MESISAIGTPSLGRDATFTVYTLGGMLVRTGEGEEALRQAVYSLERGIYIVNGKKVLKP